MTLPFVHDLACDMECELDWLRSGDDGTRGLTTSMRVWWPVYCCRTVKPARLLQLFTCSFIGTQVHAG